MAKWSGLTDKQKKKFGSKANFRAAKNKIKSSGSNVQSARQVVKAHKAKAAPKPTPEPTPKPTPKPTPEPTPKSPQGTAKQVKNINRYDTTSYGSGSKKGADKLSVADIKELTRQGFSDKEVVNYVEEKWRGGTKGGNKAQSLLNQYKDRLNAQAAPTPTTAPPKAPIQQPKPQATISPDQ